MTHTRDPITDPDELATALDLNLQQAHLLTCELRNALCGAKAATSLVGDASVREMVEHSVDRVMGLVVALEGRCHG